MRIAVTVHEHGDESRGTMKSPEPGVSRQASLPKSTVLELEEDAGEEDREDGHNHQWQWQAKVAFVCCFLF